MIAPPRTVRAASVVLSLGLILAGTASGAKSAGGLPPTSIHGVSFQVRTLADTNFCIEADPGTSEGRPLTMQQCSAPDPTQHWALPWQTSGVNQVIDSQGMCLNVRGHRADDGLTFQVERCRANRAEFVTYTTTGLLQTARGCLAIPGAATTAVITLAICDPSKPTQRWLLLL